MAPNTVIAQSRHISSVTSHESASSGRLPTDSLQSQKPTPPSNPGLVRLMGSHTVWGKESPR